VAKNGAKYFTALASARRFRPYMRLTMGLSSSERAIAMRETITVSIPHKLGKDEALRRIRDGVEDARTKFASILSIQQADWNGDTLAFRVSAVAQQVAGTIQVAESHVKLDVELPWLLAKVAKVIVPAVQKEGTLLLEKK